MRVSSIRWGIVWVGIGALFLAINFKVLDSLVFPALFSLWPVLLIAIGVELIFRKTKLYFLALLSPLMIAAAFIFAATYGSGYSWSFNEFWKDWSWGYESRKDFSYEVPFDDAIDTVHVLMNFGRSDFDFKPSKSSIFALKTSYHKRSPQISYRTDGVNAFIEYKTREKGGASLFRGGSNNSQGEIGIADNVVLYADINIKYNRPDFDFSGLILGDLKLSLKSKKAIIKVGSRSDRVKIYFSGKSNKLVLRLPAEFGIEFLGENDVLTDIAGLENAESFPGGIRSRDFDDNEKRISVLLDGSFGMVAVRYF